MRRATLPSDLDATAHDCFRPGLCQTCRSSRPFASGSGRLNSTVSERPWQTDQNAKHRNPIVVPKPYMTTSRRDSDNRRNQPASNIPVVFTPDNEPYLGRLSVYKLDNVIGATMPVLVKMGQLSRKHSARLNPLQRAACELIPQGVNLALTMREMVRQGYLFGAAVLLRPLLERVAIITYLHDDPRRVKVWQDGWKHGARPSLRKMVDLLAPDHVKSGGEKTVQMFNHLTHGDPVGAGFNLVETDDGLPGFGMGKALNEPELCDLVCEQVLAWLAALTAHATGIMGPLEGTHSSSDASREKQDGDAA